MLKILTITLVLAGLGMAILLHPSKIRVRSLVRATSLRKNSRKFRRGFLGSETISPMAHTSHIDVHEA